MAFKKYSLTSTQITKIARLCIQEQGSLKGVRAEASLMANQLETNTARQKKYGTDGNGLYNWVRNGGWFYRAAYYMDNGLASAEAVAAVKGVLCKGNRFFPQYVDEHDCISDISSISTGSKYSRDDYVKGKTIIKNTHGSIYTFWCFPAPGCDPFGYTAAAYKYVKDHGGDVPDPAEKVKVTVSLPEISEGDEGDAVTIWQIICGADPDGDFGPNTRKATKSWQKEHGLTADGIVGAASWKKGLNSI